MARQIRLSVYTTCCRVCQNRRAQQNVMDNTVQACVGDAHMSLIIGSSNNIAVTKMINKVIAIAKMLVSREFR